MHNGMYECIELVCTNAKLPLKLFKCNKFPLFQCIILFINSNDTFNKFGVQTKFYLKKKFSIFKKKMEGNFGW